MSNLNDYQQYASLPSVDSASADRAICVLVMVVKIAKASIEVPEVSLYWIPQ